MKKNILFMACCIGLMLFASCKKEVKPTLNVVTGPDYATQGTEMYSGDDITLGFTATGKDLIQFVMTVTNNGEAIYTDTESIDNVAEYSYDNTFTLEAEGTVTISGTITDAAGNTATASFDIVCNEKPNAKFVGHYEGDALINGSYDINLSSMDPIHDTLIDRPYATVVDIEAGVEINEVTATIDLDGQTNTARGTVTGNKVVFEAINSVYNMTYQSATVPLNMTYTIIGTLNDGTLDLEGTCKGNGEFNLMFISGTIELEGTLGGSLEKTE